MRSSFVFVESALLNVHRKTQQETQSDSVLKLFLFDVHPERLFLVHKEVNSRVHTFVNKLFTSSC